MLSRLRVNKLIGVLCKLDIIEPIGPDEAKQIYEKIKWKKW